MVHADARWCMLMHDDTITLDDDDDAYHCAFDVAYDTTCEYSNDFAFHACGDAMKKWSVLMMIEHNIPKCPRDIFQQLDRSA